MACRINARLNRYIQPFIMRDSATSTIPRSVIRRKGITGNGSISINRPSQAMEKPPLDSTKALTAVLPGKSRYLLRAALCLINASIGGIQ